MRDVSFSVDEGRTIGIVGESGCGKSVTAHAVMGLLPRENSIIEHGKIIFKDKDILKLTEAEMNRLRGNEIAMIFQDPMTSLNPVLTVGTQLTESLFLHKRLKKMKRVKERRNC